ncbi:hypothetical protein [Nonomuraea sp. SBT364]|uniref:hypothetical protein n=1 Tax=Nonomuraea sp. SBT364 TaxID=1580530 RepID=UPI00066BFD19|nr:hypothetical protein [Nonomuraea sp. SBT364]
MAALRDEGPVEAKVGARTADSGRASREERSPGPAVLSAARQTGVPKGSLNRKHVLRTAITIADAEALGAVSMHRHATGRDEVGQGSGLFRPGFRMGA